MSNILQLAKNNQINGLPEWYPWFKNFHPTGACTRKRITSISLICNHNILIYQSVYFLSSTGLFQVSQLILTALWSRCYRLFLTAPVSQSFLQVLEDCSNGTSNIYSLSNLYVSQFFQLSFKLEILSTFFPFLNFNGPMEWQNLQDDRSLYTWELTINLVF